MRLKYCGLKSAVFKEGYSVGCFITYAALLSLWLLYVGTMESNGWFSASCLIHRRGYDSNHRYECVGIFVIIDEPDDKLHQGAVRSRMLGAQL